MNAQDLARFMSKIQITRQGCWLWTGYLHRTGYPYFHMGGSKLTAARVGYKHFVGPLSDELALLHACGRKTCVNPGHMKSMSHRDAVEQSGGNLGGRPRVAHCRRGHPMEGDNVWINPTTGARVCKSCKRLWRRNYKRKQRRVRTHS